MTAVYLTVIYYAKTRRLWSLKHQASIPESVAMPSAMFITQSESMGVLDFKKLSIKEVSANWTQGSCRARNDGHSEEGEWKKGRRRRTGFVHQRENLRVLLILRLRWLGKVAAALSQPQRRASQAAARTKSLARPSSRSPSSTALPDK